MHLAVEASRVEGEKPRLRRQVAYTQFVETCRQPARIEALSAAWMVSRVSLRMSGWNPRACCPQDRAWQAPFDSGSSDAPRKGEGDIGSHPAGSFWPCQSPKE